MKPARYAGIEPHAVMKDPAAVTVRFALAYPDIYEVGMSYYGLFLLYELMNNREDTWCERCFAPWHDMENYLREGNRPLVTLESHTPLAVMDGIGFSLSYELNVTNVLNMLSLAGIPLRSAEREKGPIIVGGGPLMLNPRPFETFFDIIVVGEADHAILDILDVLKAMKGMNRSEIVRELGTIEGVYAPLYPRARVKRLFIENLDNAYHPVRPPIPVVGSIHNRLNVEVSRGCGNGCRFCMAGFGYRPYRERSFETVAGIIDRALRKTGYEEVSLLSLSSGDYSCLFDVINHIKMHHRGVSVALPSLKIGSIGEEEIQIIADIAHTGFTFALESASVDMRRRLNKNIDFEALVRVLPVLKKCGWRKLKLYFMIGFPWEKEEDIMSIRELVTPFAREGININLAVSPFIPKPHTPFQGLAMESESVLAEKMAMIKRALKKKNVTVRYRDIRTSAIEAVISRGDERLSPLFEYLADHGAKLEAWREFFRPELYDDWFRKEGLSMEGYLGAIAPGERLPWEFIETGVEKAFLDAEFLKADMGEGTEDCYTGCAACGIGCRRTDTSPSDPAEELTPSPEDRGPVSLIRNAVHLSYKFTFRYGKYGDSRYIGHLDTMNILLRALRSAGILIKMHGKYHPLPKISLSEALPMGIESTCELIEVETEGGILPDRMLVAEMNKTLPRGMRIFEFRAGTLQSLTRDYAFLFVSHEPVDLERVWPRERGGRYFSISKERKGIKELWKSGRFERIVKMEARRIDGIGTDN